MICSVLMFWSVWINDFPNDILNFSQISSGGKYHLAVCLCAKLQLKSLQDGWIMVMCQRPGAWWEGRWVCWGWFVRIWGRLWKYDGLDFQISSKAQRLRESYLKQIKFFLWRSVSLSSCLSSLFLYPPSIILPALYQLVWQGAAGAYLQCTLNEGKE